MLLNFPREGTAGTLGYCILYLLKQKPCFSVAFSAPHSETHLQTCFLLPSYCSSMGRLQLLTPKQSKSFVCNLTIKTCRNCAGRCIFLIFLPVPKEKKLALCSGERCCTLLVFIQRNICVLKQESSCMHCNLPETRAMLVLGRDGYELPPHPRSLKQFTPICIKHKYLLVLR